MNNRFRMMLAFALGVVAGSIGTYFIVQDKALKMIEKETQEYKEFMDVKLNHLEKNANENVAAIGRVYRQQAEDLQKEFGPNQGIAEETKENQEPTEWTEEEKEVVGEITSRYKTLKKKKELDEVMVERGLAKWDHPKDDEPEEDEQPEAPEMDDVEEQDAPIYLINDKDFIEGAPRHDKLTIYYYAGDNTLTDEQNLIIPRPEDIIGAEAMAALYEATGIVYVRNNKISTDFEIIQTNESFSDQYIQDSFPKKEPIHKGKKAVAIHGDKVEIHDLPPKVSKKKKTDGEA